MARTKLFEIPLLGTSVPVYEERSPLWGERLGIYNQTRNDIHLDAGMDVDMSRLTLMHEILEAVSALSGVWPEHALLDRISCVAVAFLRSSRGIVPWLRGKLPKDMEANVLGTVYPVVFDPSELWTGESARIDLRARRLLVEATAAEFQQQFSLIQAVLSLGLANLGTDLGDAETKAASHGVLAVATGPAKLLSFMGIPCR